MDRFLPHFGGEETEELVMLLFRTSVLIASAVLGLGLATTAQAGSSGLPAVEEIGAQSGLKLGPPSFDDGEDKVSQRPTASAGTTAVPAETSASKQGDSDGTRSR
ncbi:hypothetical protein D3874_24615 [Oleomonas cavernae]|uniref:Uncharacterized protein n=1 Tax=Oleomonas cavernae TaxID=2320859 RepID=A0A418WIC1_9PROT|nr:hypothetical protein [Oleomonas cavernae]RJF89758.1 hypothetical protein D3874_24615 [Oleomonas cavernae]